MAGLKFALGMIPNTSKIESADDNLRKEYLEYIEYEKSDDLKHFSELETEVISADFSSRKKEILSLKYKNTEEYKKEKEFIGLEKSKAIKNYFKVKDSQQLQDYNDVKSSDTLNKFTELEKFVNSDALIKAKTDMPPKEFKTSDEAAKEKEFLNLKKSSQIKKHFKFENSSAYKEYLRIDDSDELKKYFELKDLVNSEKFKEQKEYLKLSGKKKYELSKEFKKETEYNTLKKSDKVIWYQKIKKKYPFGEIEKWDMAFEENVDADELGSKKWMTRYINGDKLMNSFDRIFGEVQHKINYRHVIKWFVRKPGAFENYYYKADMYPTTYFRMAYDQLSKKNRVSGTKTYLKILKLAAFDSEAKVNKVLNTLLDLQEEINFEKVKKMIETVSEINEFMETKITNPDLLDYDNL